MVRKLYTDTQIRQALTRAKGNSVAAAKLLGCAAMTVYMRGRRLGLKVSSPGKRPIVRKKAEIEDADLWRRYKAGDPEAAEAIATRYVPLARSIVHRLRGTLPPAVDPEDLFAAALEGLLQAMCKFDPDRGYQFETYAVRRIHGAVLDELRVIDWVPRATREMQKQYAAMESYYLQEFGRKPTQDELLDALGWDGADKRKAAVRHIGSLDAVRYEDDSGREGSLYDNIELPPSRDHEAVQSVEQITRGVGLETRMILFSYFALGYRLKEIGQFLQISESRTSQLMSEGLAELRAMPKLAEAFGKAITEEGHA